jgi:hypothetical protein
MIIAGVTNVGSVQTIAANYRVAVVKDGNVYQGVIMGCPKTFSVIPYFPDDKSGGPIQFYDEDALYNKTSRQNGRALARSPGARILSAGKIFACAKLGQWLAGKSPVKNASLALEIAVR